MGINNTFKILLIAALSSCAYSQDVFDFESPKGERTVSPIFNEEDGIIKKEKDISQENDCESVIVFGGDCFFQLNICNNQEISFENLNYKCLPRNRIFPQKDLPRPLTNNLRQNKTELF